MQDPSTYQQIQPQFPEHEHLKCPRCDSTNTKFCYYNNYNLSQPRHFCKNCRRYWTKGGALRNIPIGGGSRKNTKRNSNPKRSSSSSSSSSTNTATTTQVAGKPEPSAAVYGFAAAAFDQEHHRMMDINGSFSSLLASSGQFGNLMEGLNPNGSTVRLGEFGENNLNLNSNLEANLMRNSQVELQSSNNSESFLGVQSGGGGGGGDWGGGNGWPDLAIYTPGSTFQ